MCALVCGAFAPVTCVKCVYRPLARKYSAAPRAAAENQRSYSLQEHSKAVQQLLLSARTPQSEPRRSKHTEHLLSQSKMLPAGLKLLRRLVPPPTRPLASQYDYVIVGAGSAGCVLANELTQDASASVLLIEAGTLSVSSIRHRREIHPSTSTQAAGTRTPSSTSPPASTASSRTRVSTGTGSPSPKPAATGAASSCRGEKWSAVPLP